jgi:hypothetical protein
VLPAWLPDELHSLVFSYLNSNKFPLKGSEQVGCAGEVPREQTRQLRKRSGKSMNEDELLGLDDSDACMAAGEESDDSFSGAFHDDGLPCQRGKGYNLGV